MDNRLQIVIILLAIRIANAAIHKPKNSTELETALLKVRSGDTIELDAIEYPGEFSVSSPSPIPESPITIRGMSSNNKITKLTSKTGTVFNITASNYVFRTMHILNSHVGMEISANGILLDGLTIKDTKQGIIILAGSDNKLLALTFSNVDIGLVFKSDKTTLQHSSITSGNVSVEIEPNSCCNTFDNNVFNGYVNLRGNASKFDGNVVTGGMLAVGCGNEFKSNVIQQMNLTKKCDNPDKGLNIFNKSPDMDFE